MHAASAKNRWLMAATVLMLSLLIRPIASQTTTAQASPTPSQAMPKWQIAAGGKMEFDAVSVRKDISGKFKTPSFALDPGDGWQPPDGLFHSDFAPIIDIAFAYKLFLTPAESQSLLTNQPAWVWSDAYEIQARAEGKPTKDQMRLMMQSMLADRFKLAIHFETRQLPVLALTLIRPGKLGPKIRRHADGPACDVSVPPPAKGSLVKGPDLTPPGCALFMSVPKPNHMWLTGVRGVSMSLITDNLAIEAHMDRPIVDQTGLKGDYDFSLQYTEESDQPAAAGAETAPDPQGTTFLEALKEQLGMKLVRTIAPVLVPVIDHIELPSEN